MPFIVGVILRDPDTGGLTPEGRAYRARHPTLALRQARAEAQTPWHGCSFAGFSALRECDDEDVARQLFHSYELGTEAVDEVLLDLPGSKDWGPPPSEDELHAAEQEPPFRFELAGLADVPWGNCSDAFECANERPLDIQRLLSTDEFRRTRALGKLWDALCHQGSIYSATEASLPFLIDVLAASPTPFKTSVAELVAAIWASAAMSEGRVEDLWNARGDLARGHFERHFGCTVGEKIASELALNRRIIACLERRRGELGEALRVVEVDGDVGRFLAWLRPAS